MKKLRNLLILGMTFGLSFILTTSVMSDTGWEGATRKEVGSYVETTAVSITSYTATAFVSASRKRPDGFCKMYGANTVFIGSNTLTLQTIGLPLGASDYFNVDGSFTGSIYATSEAGSSGMKIRCFFGLVR